MPAIAVPRDSIRIGAGYLYKAIIGSTLPSNTVSGGVFTDPWPAAFIPLGVTKAGHELSLKTDFSPVEAAEYLDPLLLAPEKSENKISIEILQFTAKNFSLTLNGATLTTVSGTGPTLLTKLTPVAPSSMIPTMFGWESEDARERTIIYQAKQTGEIKVKRTKGGGDPSTLPGEWTMERPPTGETWEGWYAGPTALGL
jgi:hypothetical protein